MCGDGCSSSSSLDLRRFSGLPWGFPSYVALNYIPLFVSSPLMKDGLVWFTAVVLAASLSSVLPLDHSPLIYFDDARSK